MHKRLSDITGVVLVGGKSRRMGQDKAFLAVEGVPVIERILLALQGCFEHLLLVGDRHPFNGKERQIGRAHV